METSHQGQVKFYLKVPQNKKQTHTLAVGCFVTARTKSKCPDRVREMKESFFLKVTDVAVISKGKPMGSPQRKSLGFPHSLGDVDVLKQREGGRGKEGEERRTRQDNEEELWSSSAFTAFRFC